MKKKFSAFLLTLLMAISCVFGLFACDKPKGSGSDLTKEQYAEALGSVATAYNNAYGSTSGAAATSVSIDESELVEVPNVNQAKNMLKANVAMALFLRNLCQTDDFTVVSGYQDCFVSQGEEQTEEHFNIRLKFGYDASTSTVRTTTYVASPDEAVLYKYFLSFEIVYDFEAKEMEKFTVSGYMGEEETPTSAGVNYFTFNGDTLKVLNPASETFTTFATEVLAEMSGVGEAAWQDEMPDYSVQYNAAMSEAFRDIRE